jgi:hypothetical protein
MIALAGTVGALTALAISAPPAAAASQAGSKPCGEVTAASGNLLEVHATRMSCARAKKMLRRGTKSNGTVRGYPQWTISSGGCEGILRTRRSLRYAIETNGDTPKNASFARFMVTRGCNS